MLAAKWETPSLPRNTTHYRPVWACPTLHHLAPTSNVPSSHGPPYCHSETPCSHSQSIELSTSCCCCCYCLADMLSVSATLTLSYSLCRHPSLFACDGTRAPDHFHAGHGTSQEQKQMLGYQTFHSSKQCIQTGWKDYKDWQV